MGSVYSAGAAFFTSKRIRDGPGLFPVRLLRDLSAFTFLLRHDGWSPSTDVWGSRRFSVITRSVLFSPPHGVHLPAVDLGNGENESQVLGLAWNDMSFQTIVCVHVACVWHFLIHAVLEWLVMQGSLLGKPEHMYKCTDYIWFRFFQYVSDINNIHYAYLL